MYTANGLHDWGYGSSSSAYEKSCHFAVFMLLPVFFVYQVSIAAGLIPAFAGGYFSAACFVILPVTALSYLVCQLKSGIIQGSDLLYFTFLGYFAFVVILNFLSGADQYLLEWHLISAVQMLSIYLAFNGIALGLDRNRKKYIFTTITLCTLVIALSSNGVFNPREMSENQESLVSYQGFALSLFLMSCLSIGATRTTIARLGLYLLFASALYLNGARSEFAGFLIFSTLFEFFRSHNRSLGLLSICAFSTIIILTIAFELVEIPSNRVTNLLNLESDNSSNIRDEISREGLLKIMDNPFIGSYGSYEKGYYIHNILSSWQDLGIIGFLLFLATIFTPIAILTIKVMRRRNNNRADCMILAMLSSCLILLIFGKYFTYLVAPACLGLYSAIRRNRAIT